MLMGLYTKRGRETHMHLRVHRMLQSHTRFHSNCKHIPSGNYVHGGYLILTFNLVVVVFFIHFISTSLLDKFLNSVI